MKKKTSEAGILVLKGWTLVGRYEVNCLEIETVRSEFMSTCTFISRVGLLSDNINWNLYVD